MDRTSMLEVPVERVMTRRPDMVGAEDSLDEAAGLMVSGGYRHLPVVDPDGRLVGMLSERDLRARLGSELERFPGVARQLLEETVESVMRPDPLRVSRGAPLREALEVLIDDRVGALPVTDEDDRPIGIVSYVDLLAYLADAVRHPSAKTGRRGAAAGGAGASRATRRGKRVAATAAARTARPKRRARGRASRKPGR